MTESFNGGGIGITSDEISLLCELLSFQLKHRLSRVFRLLIPFGRGMMHEI